MIGAVLFVAVAVVLLLPAVAIGAWVVRRRAVERLLPAPAGFWRANLVDASYGLREEEGLAHLRVLPAVTHPFVGLAMLSLAWGALGPRLLAPMFAGASLPEPLASFVHRPVTVRPLEWLIVVFWLSSGLLELAACLEQTDLLIEGQGDLRLTRRSWRGVIEEVLPRSAFVSLTVDDENVAVLTLKSGDEQPRTLRLLHASRLLDRGQLRADVARADAAFRARIADDAGRRCA